MSVTIKSLNTNMYFQEEDEPDQKFYRRERNAWEAIFHGIVKPMDAETETVLVLHEVSGPGVDKELSDIIGQDLDSAGFDYIEGFQTPYQLLKTIVVARRGADKRSSGHPARIHRRQIRLEEPLRTVRYPR